MDKNKTFGEEKSSYKLIIRRQKIASPLYIYIYIYSSSGILVKILDRMLIYS